MELAQVFEQATGMPFTIKFKNLPRRRDDFRPYVDEDEAERDPVNIEHWLRLKLSEPSDVEGETPEQWRARGNVVKVLPPGTAVIF